MAERRTRERDVDVSTRMTDHEALMWNVEKDPWLNPNGASLTMLDRPVDMDRFRNQIAYGVTKMPRLTQRVVPELGRLAPPTWAPDPEFDLDQHVREVKLAGPGSMRQLFDLAAQLYQEPLDRTRPLWRFVAISGVEGGRGAVYALFHHVIADGIGQLRMAELYQQLSRDEPGPGPIDLDAHLAEVLARHGRQRAGDPAADALANLVDAGRSTAGHLLRRQAGLGRRMLGEMVMWPADPGRVSRRAGDLATAVRSTASLLGGGFGDDGGEAVTAETSNGNGNGNGNRNGNGNGITSAGNGRSGSGSPLWRNRSRHRHLEHVQISLADLKAASKALGGSVNDGFMIGLTEGAVRYHEARGVQLHSLNTSFVVSTRSDDRMGGNSFTPVPVRVPAGPADFATRMSDLRRVAEQARERSDRSGGLSGLSGIINLLPTSVVTQTARRQAASMDFATSNLRGASFPLYCAGGEVEATICMGPLAGTAVNATALSHDGRFDIGLFIDPVAIEDPDDYRRCVAEAFADLLALAEPAPAPTSKRSKPATKASAAKKAAAKKKPSTAKTAATKKAAPAKPAATKKASPAKATARASAGE